MLTSLEYVHLVLDRSPSHLQPCVQPRKVYQVPLRPGDYQGALCTHAGRLLLAFRRDDPAGQVWLTELDLDFQPGPTWRLPLHLPDVDSWEDPRLFVWQGRPHVSVSGATRTSDGAWNSRIFVIELSEDGRVVKRLWPAPGRKQPLEKNWTFFGSDILRCVYSIEPHVVLDGCSIGPPLTYASPPTDLSWENAVPRGGAPPVLVGEEYYHFFHYTWLEPCGSYALGVYTFAAQPPYAIERVGRGPILYPDPGAKPVVFPCGALRWAGNWLISHGHADSECRIAAFDFAAIEEVLVHV